MLVNEQEKIMPPDAKRKPFQPLRHAIRAFNRNGRGGQAALIAICAKETGRNISTGHISQWLYRDHKVPPDCAQAIVVEAKRRGIYKNSFRQRLLSPKFAWHLFLTDLAPDEEILLNTARRLRREGRVPQLIGRHRTLKKQG